MTFKYGKIFNKGQQAAALDSVARLYLGYKFFGNLFFTYPIFYEFASSSITPAQIGMFFTAIGLCSFVAEIPTGIMADKRGRKTNALIGTVLQMVAPLAVLTNQGFASYIAAALFYGLGRAFMNGALESLVYDHKNVSQTAYRRVNALEITFGQAGILASAALGGVLFSLNHNLPFIVEAITGTLCLLLIAAMQESNKASHVASVASHRQHFMQSMRYLFATTYLRILILMTLTFSVMLGMCIQFVNEAAMIEHGLQGQTRGFLIAGAGIATIVILHTVLLRAVKSDIARITYIAGGAAVAYICMSLGQMPLFLAGYLLWSCLNATSSFLRVMLNDRIPGSHRSTILSNFKALAVLLGMGASTLTGLLVQSAHTPRAAYAVFGFLACAVLVPCAWWLIANLRQAQQISTQEQPDQPSLP